MRVEHSKRANQRRFALMVDHLERNGISRSDPSVRLSGRILSDPSIVQKKPWITNIRERQLLLSTYHLDSRHHAAIKDKLSAFQPCLIDGYPTAILELLELMDGYDWKNSRLKLIVCTAETITPDLRARISELSGVLVLDYYSASEGTPLVQQCSHGTYHVRWQSGTLHVRNDVGVFDHGDGELIATSFLQDRTPLINYATGDFCVGLQPFGAKLCPCGLVTPTIESLVGRVEDKIITRRGQKLGMFSYRTLKHVSGILAAQIIQHDASSFTVRAVLNYPSKKDTIKKAIQSRFEDALGYPIRLSLDVCKSLPKGPNGKIKSVVSELNGA